MALYMQDIMGFVRSTKATRSCCLAVQYKHLYILLLIDCCIRQYHVHCNTCNYSIFVLDECHHQDHMRAPGETRRASTVTLECQELHARTLQVDQRTLNTRDVAENRDTTQNTTRVAERIDYLSVTHLTGGPAVPGAARTAGQASKTAVAR